MKDVTEVKLEQFGRDHWSLLSYIETRCVDGMFGVGKLDIEHLRDRDKKSPIGEWKEDWGTRLKGYDPKTHPELRLGQHDDIDCLEDLDAAGLIEVISYATLSVKLTEEGGKIADRIRKHKRTGGNFSNFEL